MGIWKPTSIEQTPEIELIRWNVHEVSSDLWPEKTRHFVGYNLTESEGRVSSAIIEFDIKTMTGRTKSGRVYKLSGTCGVNLDAIHVWGYWKDRNEITEDICLKIEDL